LCKKTPKKFVGALSLLFVILFRKQIAWNVKFPVTLLIKNETDLVVFVFSSFLALKVRPVSRLRLLPKLIIDYIRIN
jgi:hypothetical protein